MLIETDIIYAFVKNTDRLKTVADKLIWKINEGELGIVSVSRETLHELYYVSMKEGISLDEYIRRVAALTSINNLSFLPTTSQIDLLALTLMRQYNLSSIFDAYHAATALNQVKDRTIITTDHIYDKIPGLVKIEPQTLIN
jgi:predicted nucleic acid-binding protein